MVSTSNRFISVAIGKGDKSETNEIFNICLVIHIAIAILTLLIALPLGDWYINNYINYNGSIRDAISVYHYTLIGSVISFIGVPYNGLLMAKERFLVFSVADALVHILKMVMAFLLIYYFTNKLVVYALTQGFLTAFVILIYIVYSRKYFKDIIRWNISHNWAKYKEVLSFSGWVSFGALATIGKNQGAAILVNAFFNTTMNTALGLANTVNSLILTFSNAVAQPIAPQITKSYSAGDMERCSDLLVMSIKLTYFVMLCISVPFIIAGDWIFSLWLGQVPPYVVEFTILIIIDALVTALNSGISNLIFASGKIMMYQVSINTLRVLAIVGAYIVLKMGGPAPSLLYAYIVFSVIIFFTGQSVLHRTLNYNTSILWRRSYIPSLAITIAISLYCILKINIYPIINIFICEILILLLYWFIGASTSEKKVIKHYIQKIAK